MRKKNAARCEKMKNEFIKICFSYTYSIQKKDVFKTYFGSLKSCKKSAEVMKQPLKEKRNKKTPTLKVIRVMQGRGT